MLTRLREDGERGVVMVTVLLLSMIMLLIVAGTMAYALGSQPLSRRDQDWNAALSAAEAGLDDYLFRLNENDQYYLYGAPPLPAPPDGNQAFTGWVSVPDSGSASVTCTAGEDSNIPCFRYAVNTTNLTSQGAIIITATGRSRNVTRTVQATVRRRSFIDYLYFTDYETTDPAAYPTASNSNNSTWAQTNCAKHYYEGRVSNPPTNGGCTDINFGSGDVISGPLHSNDAILICGSPTFSGNVTTSWQGAGSPLRRWRANGNCSNSPSFSRPGDPAYASPLTMPPSNVAIKADADGNPPMTGTGCLYTGPTSITLNSTGTMTVVSPFTKSTNAGCLGANVALPANGVIYVQNVPSTITDPNYTAGCPYNVTAPGGGVTRAHPLGYPQQYDITPYGCRNGDVFLSGVLKGRLTIAADNNIDVINSVTYQGGTGGSDLLGLIANNYVEVYHPVGLSSAGTPSGACDGGFVNGGCNLIDKAAGLPTALRLPTIQAAILSVNHSFRVQNYQYGDNNPGSQTMRITINGAIAQRYRGIVGIINNTGYLKNYNYDNRLKYQSPPRFLTPIAAAWQIVTWIEQKPACAWNTTSSPPLCP